ncbi:MAG: cupin domain-containing protein [Bacteroidales bacterium]|nr:cupin domain-containing protein [Bacteroidales bacterium]
MDEAILSIANRMRGLREATNTPVELIAKACKVSIEQYMAYESGTQDIPVGILYQFARFFGIDMTVLLTGEEPHMHRYCLIRKNEGVRVERSKMYKYESLAYNFSQRRMEPLLVEVGPEVLIESTALNSHAGQEFNLVIEGRMELRLGDKVFVLDEGDAIYFDSSIPHGMRALDNKPCKFLAVVV